MATTKHYPEKPYLLTVQRKGYSGVHHISYAYPLNAIAAAARKLAQGAHIVTLEDTRDEMEVFEATREGNTISISYVNRLNKEFPTLAWPSYLMKTKLPVRGSKSKASGDRTAAYQ